MFLLLFPLSATLPAPQTAERTERKMIGIAAMLSSLKNISSTGSKYDPVSVSSTSAGIASFVIIPVRSPMTIAATSLFAGSWAGFGSLIKITF